jgi:hypothetical protein
VGDAMIGTVAARRAKQALLQRDVGDVRPRVTVPALLARRVPLACGGQHGRS